MTQMIYQQVFCLGIFTITGIAIGILFDTFRILRRSFKTADWVTYVQDILFWILTGCIILFSIFRFNNGEIRSYVFLGLAIGVILYMITISRFFIEYSVLIINFMKKILSVPIHFFSNIINKMMIKPIHFLVINMRKNIQTCNKKIKNTTKFNKKLKKKQAKT